jgi:hypothetical protein
MIASYHPTLCEFENIVECILDCIILYSMETVLSIETSKWLVESSTITIWTSGLQATMLRLHIQVRVFYFPFILWRFENIGAIWSVLLHSEKTVLSVRASSFLLVASSTTTISTNWLQRTMLIVHIRVRVFYLPPFLWRFENIGVIWSMLLHSEKTVQSVKASSSLVASSTITIQTSGLQGTIIRLHIGDMLAYYHPSFCTFENIGLYFGLYPIVLYGDSSRCRGSYIGSGVIHNYHTDKWVTDSND